MHFRSKKLLNAARDQSCVMCGSHGTTVAAHANYVEYGKGRGIKAPDCLVAFLCSTCHYSLDQGPMSKAEKWEMWHRAFVRTIVRLFDQGIVQVRK